MATILAYGSPALGHLLPVSALLRELAGRGHDVHLRTLAGGVSTGEELGLQTAAVDPRIEVQFAFPDGARVPDRKILGTVRGPLRSILTAERTALNLVQRLSGVATATSRAVAAMAGTRCRVLDTRKTTPGWRILEKAAVRAGGGTNHRFGLFDGVLIKDNHIAAVGSISEAVRRARAAVHHLMKVEVEVVDLRGVDEALAAGAEILLLDNMDTATMRQAVQRVAGRAKTEASGGITQARLKEIAEAGVDYVSMGALTHSARGMDISLEVRAG